MRVIIMYLRFVVAAPKARVAFGLFQSDAVRVLRCDLPDWLSTAIEEHYDWFNEHLPVPKRLTVVSRRRHVYAGLCWFRPEARAHIARARELALLLAEADLVTHVLKTRAPGQVLYRDAFQIVAKPDGWRPADED